MSGSENGSLAREEKPEVEDAGKQPLSVKLKDQSNNEVFFKIKRSTQLKKVFDAYCQRQEIARGAVRFLFDGDRLQDNDTPETRDMEDGDCIEVFLEQIGGREDEVKPEGVKQINIVVKDQHNQEVIFKTKSSTPFKKLMGAYYKQKGLEPDSLRFFSAEGTRILDDHTPDALEMEDGDVVDVHMYQQGGHAVL